jgi:osmotically-inducible protein OsmY
MKALRLALLGATLVVASAQTTDDMLYDQVRLRLTQDVDVNGGGLDVVVKDGVVTLRGRVKSERVKKKAAKLAAKVKGVKTVTNELIVNALPVAN